VILGGFLLFPRDRAKELIEAYDRFVDGCPDELTTSLMMTAAPEEDPIPAQLQGQQTVQIVVVHCGDLEDAERAVKPLRDLGPAADLVQPMPYTALQSMLDEGGPKGIRGYFKAEFLEELTDEVVEKLVEHGAKRAGPLTQLLMEPMGGAISRVGEDDTALGRRDVPWCYHALAMWMEPDEETADAHISWAKSLADDLKPHSTDGVYLNYISDEGDERVRSTYGPVKYDRLVALKDRYDPDNMFRLNQNIRPSGNGRG